MALHHARAIARSGGLAQLVAVADPVPASLASVRQASLGVREFPSLEELLATVAVDVVHVCTPANTHATLARAALGAGCHVYVEKPFAESTVAAEQVLSLASRQGLQVCPGHQCLFERPAVRAQALLPYLGDVVHVESFFAFTPAGPRPTGTAPLAPHHQLLDILPHPVYLLEHFLRQGDARSPIARRRSPQTASWRRSASVTRLPPSSFPPRAPPPPSAPFLRRSPPAAVPSRLPEPRGCSGARSCAS